MSIYLVLFIGYVLGRLDEIIGRRAGHWLGTKTRNGWYFMRSCWRYYFKKPYPIGTLHVNRPITTQHFDWDFGDWCYGFSDGNVGASHGLVKWYKDRE